MAAKSMTITLADVREYISTHPGTRYTSGTIARHFGAKTQDISRLCNELAVRGPIKSCAPSTTKLYYLPSQAEIAASNQVRYVAPATVLKGYDAMMRRIAANCEAGR